MIGIRNIDVIAWAIVGAALSGCQEPRSSEDAAAPGASGDAPALVPARDGSSGGCEWGAHVDCFWRTPTCRDGVVTIPIHEPIPYCTNEEARQAYLRGVCEARARRHPCPSGRCAELNPRFDACVRRRDPIFAMVDGLCAGTVRGEGEPCTHSAQCFFPALDVEAALRCDVDAGRCARAPRSDDAGVAGSACTHDAECAPGTVCAQDGSCRWRCTVVVDGGLAYDAASAAADAP